MEEERGPVKLFLLMNDERIGMCARLDEYGDEAIGRPTFQPIGLDGP